MRWIGLGFVILMAAVGFWFLSQGAESGGEMEAPPALQADPVKETPDAELAAPESEPDRLIEGDRQGTESESTVGDPLGPLEGGKFPEKRIQSNGKLAVAVRFMNWAPAKASDPVRVHLLADDVEIKTQDTELDAQTKFEKLHPGKYSILAYSKGSTPTISRHYHFELSVENSPRGLSLEMTQAPTWRVIVTNDLQQPVFGVSIVDLNQPIDGQPWGAIKTDARGEAVAHFGLGTPVSIQVSSPGHVTEHISSPYTVGTVTDMPVTLRRIRPVGGLVHWPDGSLAEGVSIFGRSEFEGDSATTDARGRFALNAMSFADTTLYARGGGESEQDFSGTFRYAATDDLTRLDLWLEPSPAYRGLLRTPDGQPIANMGITLSATDNSRVTRRATSDGEGRFEVTGLYPGTYHITVDSRSRVLGQLKVEGGIDPPEATWEFPHEKKSDPNR